MIRTLTIVGVGLIGGSIGLAARKRGVAARVVGVGRQPETLDRARALGAADETTTDLAAVAAADVAVFCTPVDLIAGQVVAAASGCSPGTLLTDAGSTKAEIARAVAGRLPPGVAFVGSHPLAGSEKRGPDAADADLFVGRVAVVTPTPTDKADVVERTCAFWRALGARVEVMSPEAHDAALAVTSHLPHLAASALAALLPDALRGLTATGFRDTTRVAAGDPALWTGIFLQNRAAMIDAIGRLQHEIADFKSALMTEDAAAVAALLARGKRNRDALGNRDPAQGD